MRIAEGLDTRGHAFGRAARFPANSRGILRLPGDVRRLLVKYINRRQPTAREDALPRRLRRKCVGEMARLARRILTSSHGARLT